VVHVLAGERVEHDKRGKQQITPAPPTYPLLWR
jgi:hypothetical protein